MLGLLFSLWLGAAPPDANSNVTSEITASNDPAPGQETIEPPLEGPLQLPATQDPPAESSLPDPRPRRLSKGKRVLVGAGVGYGLGVALQWATAGGSGMLADARPGGTSGVTLGMTVGGMAMVQGLVLGGIGARDLARESHGQDHRAKPLIAGGATVAGLGAGAIFGSALFWPSVRARCPIGAGCSLAGIHLGGAALSVGTGMISYGNALRERDPNYRRMSRKAEGPVITGSVLLGSGYLLSAALGLSIWQGDPADDLARRTRNRLLIPVVGPWIHAAGPDAPVFMALVTGALGAAQIGGALALAVGVGIAKSERRRDRERVQVTVAPSFDGVSIAGRF